MKKKKAKSKYKDKDFKMTKIASVGVRILDEDKKNKIDCFDFSSNQSLSAYDIIIFSPRIFNLYNVDFYMRHWQSELNKASRKHKLMVYIVPENIYINDASNKLFNVLSIIPCFISLGTRATIGSDIISSNSSLKNVFDNFCKIFEHNLNYKYIFEISREDKNIEKILETKDGDILGVYWKNENSIMIQGVEPNLLFAYKPQESLEKSEGLVKSRYNDELKVYTTSLELARKFKSFLIKLYNVLCQKQQIEEVPDWIKNDTLFDLIEEKKIDAEIIENQNRIEELLELNSSKEREKNIILSLKDLLFATDKQLEDAVNYALEIIGFKPKQFVSKNGDLQIDTFIEYENIKIVGETKGVNKSADNHNINQLTGNRDQYFSEECLENENIPKAILFVNSFREQPLKNRNKQDAVTPKVLKLAEASSVSIVWTPDLFFVAQYIKNTEDEVFAQTCRKVIIDNKHGFVDFPKIPK